MVTTWFPTQVAPGAGSFIAKDVVALSQDHQVEVLHLAPPELDDGVRSLTHEGVPVERLPIDVRTPRGVVAARRAVRPAVRDADILHTMAAPALLPFVLRRPAVPWVHTEHWSGVANLRTSPRARRVLPLSRRAFDGPARVVAVSEYLAREVRALRRGPVDVIGNIVDLPGTVQLEEPAARQPGPLRLLGVGGVSEHKGWRIALEALEHLRASGTDVELTWLGAGGELELLRERAASLPVSAPGHVSAAEVRAAMAAADVFVLPTVSETFSLVTLEALSVGTPVVTTGHGAHTDFVRPGCGVVVERTAEAVAAGVLTAADLDRTAVREHGRRLAEQFSEQRFREQYSEIYAALR